MIHSRTLQLLWHRTTRLSIRLRKHGIDVVREVHESDSDNPQTVAPLRQNTSREAVAERDCEVSTNRPENNPIGFRSTYNDES